MLLYIKARCTQKVVVVYTAPSEEGLSSWTDAFHNKNILHGLYKNMIVTAISQ